MYAPYVCVHMGVHAWNYISTFFSFLFFLLRSWCQRRSTDLWPSAGTISHTARHLLRQICLHPGPDTAQVAIALQIPAWTITFDLWFAALLNPQMLSLIQCTAPIAYNGIKDTGPLTVSFPRKIVNFKQFHYKLFDNNLSKLNKVQNSRILKCQGQRGLGNLYSRFAPEVYCSFRQVN